MKAWKHSRVLGDYRTFMNGSTLDEGDEPFSHANSHIDFASHMTAIRTDGMGWVGASVIGAP